MRWMWYGLAAMFVLIGVAAVLAVYYGGLGTSSFNFDWVWNIIGLLFVVWIFSMLIRGGWWGRGYRYRRRWYGNDEYQILRERYARGEITKEQFEQMTKDLQQHET